MMFHACRFVEWLMATLLQGGSVCLAHSYSCVGVHARMVLCSLSLTSVRIYGVENHSISLSGLVHLQTLVNLTLEDG